MDETLLLALLAAIIALPGSIFSITQIIDRFRQQKKAPSISASITSPSRQNADTTVVSLPTQPPTVPLEHSPKRFPVARITPEGVPFDLEKPSAQPKPAPSIQSTTGDDELPALIIEDAPEATRAGPGPALPETEKTKTAEEWIEKGNAYEQDGSPRRYFAWWHQVILYLSLIIGVLFASFGQSNQGSLGISSVNILPLLASCVISLIVAPQLFHSLRITAGGAFWALIALFLQQGVFWGFIISVIFRALSTR